MTDRTEDSALRALLEVVQRDLDRRRRAVTEEAEEKERQILRQARATARQRVSRAVREERDRIAEEVERSSARHAGETRERRQHAARDMLAQAWELLPEVLRERWNDPEARRLWVRAVAEQAHSALPPGQWHVTHPPDFDPDAHSEAFEGGESTDQPNLSFEKDEGLDAGIRIQAGDASLDGSIRGLLTDRRSVEGRLLSELLGEEPR